MQRSLLAVLFVALSLSAFDLRADSYDIPIYEPAGVFPGTTLFADMSNPRRPRLVEVDMTGKVVWSYHPPPSVRGALLDAALLPNGHILFTASDTGIFEITREGEVVWKYLDAEASHDADRLANGNTLYNRGWQKKGGEVVREVDPQGKTVWSWTGLAHLDREPFADIDQEGWMHVNSVSRLENSNTLISMRNFNTIVEVSPAGEVVWSITFGSKGGKGFPATKGRIKGVRNHEPEVLDNGNLLLAIRNPHRYIEVDRAKKEIVWQWEHPDGHRAIRTNREANRLPNGNTLVSTENRFLEVTKAGEIVWELRVPKGGKNHRKLHKAIRIAPDGRAFGG